VTELTHVDLFAGVGGFSLALKRAGAKTVAAVEIDKHCQNILGRHNPEAKIFGDIKEVTGNDFLAAGFDPENGIYTGGFPCQDISIAGLGAGLAGNRSGLFWEIVRLLEELHPKWFVLENVPRLLSINGGRDMATVIQALVECGYGIAWRVLDAQYFGVPQRRRRIFIVGYLGGTGREAAEVLFERQGMPGDSAPGQEAEPEAAGDAGAGADGRGATVRVTSPLLAAHRGVPSADEADQLVVSPVAALTANGVGTCGADDNQAQAGHLIADSIP
jgi:DNA (cytosine-5)-methyltransferase 1